jgi:hypothetical protein
VAEASFSPHSARALTAPPPSHLWGRRPALYPPICTPNCVALPSLHNYASSASLRLPGPPLRSVRGK